MKPKRPSPVRWPLIVVGILTTHVGAMMYAVVLCSRGNAVVIPDYYDRAVHVDETKAARARAASVAPMIGEDGR